MVVITPMVNNAGVSVNGRRTFEPTVLDHGDILLLGRNHFFRFIDPTFEKVNEVNISKFFFDKVIECLLITLPFSISEFLLTLAGK